MDNRIYNIATFVIFILLFGCTEKKIMNQEQESDPPKAEIKEYQHKIHNDIRVDEFYVDISLFQLLVDQFLVLDSLFFFQYNQIII